MKGAKLLLIASEHTFGNRIVPAISRRQFMRPLEYYGQLGDWNSKTSCLPRHPPSNFVEKFVKSVGYGAAWVPARDFSKRAIGNGAQGCGQDLVSVSWEHAPVSGVAFLRPRARWQAAY